MLALDDTSKPGSDAVSATDDILFSDDAGNDFEAPEGGAARPVDDEADGGISQRQNLINQAKQNISRSAGQKAADKISSSFGQPDMFNDDSEQGRQRARELAKQKARKLAQEKIGKAITDEGLKQGFEKGLSKGAGSLAKEGAKKAAGKAAGQAAGKAAAQTAAKGAGQLAAKGLQTAVTGAGAATGAETFGLGFLLAFLLNIAISLGVSDAVDAGFELKAGNVKHATFLAIRAASKVGMFVWVLLTMAFVFSVGGFIFGVPMLVALNIYMIAGFAFKKIPQLQGLVWWEIGIILVLDIMAFLIVMAFVGAMGYYLCSSTGINSGGVIGGISNVVLGFVTSVYDWWNSSTAGSVAYDFCQYVTGGK
jgi:hypothetical protein